MAVLPQETLDLGKNGAYAWFLVGLTDEHTALGQAIGNRLVRALAGEERGWYQGNVIQLRPPDGFGWFHDVREE